MDRCSTYKNLFLIITSLLVTSIFKKATPPSGFRKANKHALIISNHKNTIPVPRNRHLAVGSSTIRTLLQSRLYPTMMCTRLPQDPSTMKWKHTKLFGLVQIKWLGTNLMETSSIPTMCLWEMTVSTKTSSITWLRVSSMWILTKWRMMTFRKKYKTRFYANSNKTLMRYQKKTMRNNLKTKFFQILSPQKKKMSNRRKSLVTTIWTSKGNLTKR